MLIMAENNNKILLSLATTLCTEEKSPIPTTLWAETPAIITEWKRPLVTTSTNLYAEWRTGNIRCTRRKSYVKNLQPSYGHLPEIPHEQGPGSGPVDHHTGEIGCRRGRRGSGVIIYVACWGWGWWGCRDGWCTTGGRCRIREGRYGERREVQEEGREGKTVNLSTNPRNTLI